MLVAKPRLDVFYLIFFYLDIFLLIPVMLRLVAEMLVDKMQSLLIESNSASIVYLKTRFPPHPAI